MPASTNHREIDKPVVGAYASPAQESGNVMGQSPRQAGDAVTTIGASPSAGRIARYRVAAARARMPSRERPVENGSAAYALASRRHRKSQGTARPRLAAFWLILPLIITGMLLVFYYTGDQTQRSKIEYGFFRQQLDANNIADDHGEPRQDSGHVQEGSGAPPVETDKGPKPGPKLREQFSTDLPGYVGQNLNQLIYQKLGASYGAEEDVATTAR